MTLSRNTSVSLALSFATSVTTAPTPIPPPRTSSLCRGPGNDKYAQSEMGYTSEMNSPREFSLYKGVSDRPLGWKHRRKVVPDIGQAAREANIKRWDGPNRSISDWDGLRRVCLPQGNLKSILDFMTLILWQSINFKIGPGVMVSRRRLPGPSIWTRPINAGTVI